MAESSREPRSDDDAVEPIPMRSLPGHTMVYEAQPGLAGVWIVAPNGSQLGFGGPDAIDDYAREVGLSAEDVRVLHELEKRADLHRRPAGSAIAEALEEAMALVGLPQPERERVRQIAGQQLGSRDGAGKRAVSRSKATEPTLPRIRSANRSR